VMQLSLQVAAGLRCASPGEVLTILNPASAADDARAWSGTSALGPLSGQRRAGHACQGGKAAACY
jgi:hypothetical protein